MSKNNQRFQQKEIKKKRKKKEKKKKGKKKEIKKMATPALLNQTLNSNYEDFDRQSHPADFIFQSAEKVFEEIGNGQSSDRVLVICKNLSEAKLCTFLLNAGTSYRFTCIDRVSEGILADDIDHLVVDYNNLDVINRGLKRFDTFIIWSS